MQSVNKMIEAWFLLLAKIFPVILQFVFSYIGATKRVMRHILRRQVDKCPFIVDKIQPSGATRLNTSAFWKKLNQSLQTLPCLTTFSAEASRLQSTIGLGLTLFTSIWLSESRLFTIIASIALFVLIITYILVLDSEKQTIDERGLTFAFGCTIIGVIFVYASTIT